MEERNPYAPPLADQLRADRPAEAPLAFEFVADQELFFDALNESNRPPGLAITILFAVVVPLVYLAGIASEIVKDGQGAEVVGGLAVAAVIVTGLAVGIALAIRATAISRARLAVQRRISELQQRQGLVWGVWRGEFDVQHFRLTTPDRNFEWPLTELAVAMRRDRTGRLHGGMIVLTPGFLLPIPGDAVSEMSVEGLEDFLRRRAGKPLFRVI